MTDSPATQTTATAASGPSRDDLEFADYLARTAQFEDVVTDQQTSLDRTLVALSGGAFGLSILFASEMAADPVRQPLLLFGAWVAFGAALVLAVLSFAAAVQASERQLQIHRRRERLRQMGIDRSEVSGVNPWTWVVGFTNFGALVSFVAGVVLLAAFAWRNLTW